MFQRITDHDLETRAPGEEVGCAGKYRGGTQLGEPTEDGPGCCRDFKEGREDRTTLTWILIRQIVTTFSPADRLQHRPKIIFALVQSRPKTLTGPEHTSVENRIPSTLIDADASGVKRDKDASQFQSKKMGREQNESAFVTFKSVENFNISDGHAGFQLFLRSPPDEPGIECHSCGISDVLLYQFLDLFGCELWKTQRKVSLGNPLSRWQGCIE
jgi:hypothetical protein